jgi:hypothetical protein
MDPPDTQRGLRCRNPREAGPDAVSRRTRAQVARDSGRREIRRLFGNPRLSAAGGAPDADAVRGAPHLEKV